ncbi:TPA_exp: hypothetical protein A8136_2621 [Trichophyton benhamiae CBS 112371]|nr:TPA_exp: hypothetical protein A8136_2621 [Trichophyton benhamiae CBS 112371]
MATGPNVKKPEPPKPRASEYLDRLDLAEAATVDGSLGEKPKGEEFLLGASLKRLLLGSGKIWEGPARGLAVKCSEGIVAKVIMGNKEYTRPHGLIAFAPFCVVSMSYIPGMTPTKAWPSLAHEDKLFIQRQLDDIFHRLRTI